MRNARVSPASQKAITHYPSLFIPHFSSSNKCRFLLLLLLFVLSFIPRISFSQSVSATLDRDKIVLGEQVTLELKAENINTQTSSLQTWFLFPDTINHLEILKRSPVDTIVVNGATSYLQTLTLTSFDSGSWKLPSLFAVVQHTNASKKDTLQTSGFSLTVLPVDVSNLKQYHPMKDIIDVDVKPDYWLMASLVLGAVFLLLLVVFLARKKKNKKPAAPPAIHQSMLEKAISGLEKLLQENPPSPQFYNRLDEICRSFFQSATQVQAMPLTGDELMMKLNGYMQPDARTSFYQLLRLVSAVKFAKYQPAEDQKAIAVATAKEALTHIYQHCTLNPSTHAH